MRERERNEKRERKREEREWVRGDRERFFRQDLIIFMCIFLGKIKVSIIQDAYHRIG